MVEGSIKTVVALRDRTVSPPAPLPSVSHSVVRHHWVPRTRAKTKTVHMFRKRSRRSGNSSTRSQAASSPAMSGFQIRQELLGVIMSFEIEIRAASRAAKRFKPMSR